MLHQAPTILPLTPADYLPAATLEALVFNDDTISVLCFGPKRAAPEVLQKRASGFTGPNDDGNVRMSKAVSADGELVGFAMWKFYTGAKEPKEVEGKGKGGEGPETKNTKWPEGANVELCEEIFGQSDLIREESMGPVPHVVLHILAVHPAHQNRGIGSALMRDGIQELEEKGVRAWLGATENAVRLYERSGFVVDKVLEFDMGKWGGQSVEKHTLMIRPTTGG